ncbi:hypothetical protein [Niveibacterium sp.]
MLHHLSPYGIQYRKKWRKQQDQRGLRKRRIQPMRHSDVDAMQR